MTSIDTLIRRAADNLRCADALLITAGAGMGVDSGLPDFRGEQGFWGAYPALGRAQLHFQDIANPQAFAQYPELAWGFYGHRMKLYRETAPSDSFRILLDIAETMPFGAFVFTSNVDGHFQKAGFPARRVCEVHGSIHHLQCVNGCMGDIWSAGPFQPEIDEERCLITSAMPTCPYCGDLARPNILMFGDLGWLAHRQRLQLDALNTWQAAMRNPVVIEIGAGTSIPTVRQFGESMGCPLIRINRREHEVERPDDIGLPMGGLEALRQIADELGLDSQPGTTR